MMRVTGVLKSVRVPLPLQAVEESIDLSLAQSKLVLWKPLKPHIRWVAVGSTAAVVQLNQSMSIAG